MNAESSMTETTEASQERLATVPSPGAGELLRRAREASGLHVGALAVMLKVPVHRLEALEAERWEQLPDTVFVRALASSVCRALRVDPAPVLLKLPQAAPQPIEVGSPVNTPFRGTPGPSVTPHGTSQFSRPLMLAVGAMLLGALALAIFPSIHLPGSRSQGDPDPGKPFSSAPAPDSKLAPVDATSGDLAPAPQPVASVSAPVAESKGASTQREPPSVAPPMSVGAERQSEPARTAAGDAIMVFRAQGPSWIQVIDATGAIVLKKELVPGETASAVGALPLAVVVGRADVTTVEVRGKPMDLAPLAKNNVARFEVKE